MSVVDASVWVSRLVAQDVHHQASRCWLDGQLAQGALLVAPMLLLAEVAGAIRRRSGQAALAEQAIETIVRVPGLRLVALDTHLGHEAARMAARLGLRGADAVYVALAQQLGLPLVTWDPEQTTRAESLVRVQIP